ncbi:MAG: hypothetical protein IJU87_01600 [Lachnospiraceae bacterium]|nr:hypothetical protein [Lachnospiraceae bacterium]
MGRPRSPDSIEAEKLFHEGMKMVDIAKKLKVPEGTVRRWKHTQGWDGNAPSDSKKKQSERSEKSDKRKANVRKRKGGAQPGNKFAVGHKPNTPKGNQRATKHGAYSTIYWNVLSDEERAAVAEMDTDPEKALEDQIKLFTAREIRLSNIVNKYRNMKTEEGKDIPFSMQLTMRSEKKRVFDGTPEEQERQKKEYDRLVEEKVKKGERMPGREISIMNQTENKDAIILRAEDELTRCSNAKNRAIRDLASIRAEKAKLQMETAGNDTVANWVSSILAEEGGEDE